MVSQCNSYTTKFQAFALSTTLILVTLGQKQLAHADEFLVISGGPALNRFEADKQTRHDRFWGNFIQTAETRLIEILKKKKSTDVVTWMVFRTGYERRSQEESRNLIAEIEQRAAKLNVTLKWFRKTRELISYINQGLDRSQHPIKQLDIFAHSNKACVMFDYSNRVDGVSTVFLHTRDLPLISSNAFRKDAYTTNWGCHAGEYWVDRWRQATDTYMWGAIGKTNYSYGAMMPIISTPGGRWVKFVPSGRR